MGGEPRLGLGSANPNPNPSQAAAGDVARWGGEGAVVGAGRATGGATGEGEGEVVDVQAEASQVRGSRGKG